MAGTLEDFNEFIYVEKQIRIPSFKMGYEHFHTYYEIFYLKTGQCTYTVNKHKYHLEAGDIFIVAPGESHQTYYEGSIPCERITVYCKFDQLIPGFWENHHELKSKFRSTSKIVLNPLSIPNINIIFDQMLKEHDLPMIYSEEVMTLLLCQLLLCIERSGIFVYESLKQQYNPTLDIEHALRYIDLNYNLQITLEDVAETINLAPTYLSRKFKKVTGLTFKEYLTQIRIKQASQALLTTDDSITKIAMDCGFMSSNYFKDSFRKMTGVSPRAFRKQDRTFNFEANTTKDIIHENIF